MNDKPRLIERAFPLKQASLDSVHEKNVRHGHISTLHIWPARRPLAASRAALIATLLPDPGSPEERAKLCERIGGKVVQKVEKKKMPGGRAVERIKEETEGGILHWLGSEPASGGRKKKEEYRRKAEFYEKELEWFRQEIHKAYGGRAPRVLDPFAGGGAIPLEAMRLGCDTTAVDINPVAWFILKCTLEYPHLLTGKTRPLPEFVLHDEEFMEAFYKAHPELVGKTKLTKKQTQEFRSDLFLAAKADSDQAPEADLAWHVRAWGKWVLDRARRDLAKFYPTYADFEPLKAGKRYEREPMRLVPLRDDGTAAIEELNAEFGEEYLADRSNPRWVAKPTVAYLWARTVTCKNCRATLPLLKTRWLCKKVNKRVLLTMVPNAEKTGAIFGVESDVPLKGGNAAQRREHDKRIGAGTMSRAGAQCPCCPTIMTMEDIRVEGRGGRLRRQLTAVVVDTQEGKDYRPPMQHELDVAEMDEAHVDRIFEQLPAGHLEAMLPLSRLEGNSGFRVILYGIDSWRRLVLGRQYAMLGTFSAAAREARKASSQMGYQSLWSEAIGAYMSICVDRLVDSSTTVCHWQVGGEFSVNTLQRFALPMSWDFSEVNTLSSLTGSFGSAVNWVALVIAHCLLATRTAPVPHVFLQSSTTLGQHNAYDLILTDPPYYDAIAYSDVMDLFYCWLRRSVSDLTPDTASAFALPIGPKWDHSSEDGELIDDRSRFDGDAAASKSAYERGMAQVFRRCFDVLSDNGRFVVVFAHKHPNAWETLVSAMIASGFVVDGSWPIQTERTTRAIAIHGAALSSSVWLVCKKRPATARPGWDNQVLEMMRTNIAAQLREFWDAGIRGPDFVWAATGPALEAYSKHPVVKKANDAGKTMGVSEFLSHVRRMVVDFVVGQVLTGSRQGADLAAADRMDAPTAYYLLHRHDFGLEEAPSGACILYATACGLSDGDLESTWDVLIRCGTGSAGQNQDEADDEDVDPEGEADPDEVSDSGSKVKLKTWTQRKHKSMGYEAPGGQPVPLIDRIHRLMHLWRAGDVLKVDEFLDDYGLRRNELFRRLLQSLIELSPSGCEERTLLESLSNHLQASGARRDYSQISAKFREEV